MLIGLSLVKAMAIVSFLPLALGCRSADDPRSSSRSTTVAPVKGQPKVPPPRHVPPGRSVVVAAVGDIVQKGKAQRKTADLMERLIERRKVAGVLLLGDLQYPRGEYHDFIRQYRHSWGRPSIKSLTRPVPGNHEYDHGKSSARGYFDYFSGPGESAGQAGVRGVGYYSFEMGDWHFVALNTSDGCKKIECDPGSPMYEWLKRDLAANQRRCTLVYYHHPRYQFGAYHPDTPRIQPIWKALYDHGVDISLAGHEHNFQALAPLDDEGLLDTEHGIHSFVVGTGGGKPYVGSRRSMHPANLRALQAKRYGILLLTLHADEFEWEFVATTRDGTGEALARGGGRCHDAPPSRSADGGS
jgi:acid phosphatase type 7